ncbi:hypothetical protein [Bacillus massiliglaciei]|uniref:hypothetical protein n=1 Tax=Bacillus massiliglaciei TaxID=1816693 RepID=UPI000DA61B9F|nr:hypothetical protein [Bacillus massiliglaciei]
MTYQVRLLKGILEPKSSGFQLVRAEEVTRFGWKLAATLLISMLVFALYGYFGVGSESFSKELANLTDREYQMGRLLVLAGNLAAGAVYPVLFLFLGSLVFWIAFDVSYIKCVIVQMFLFLLLMFEKAVTLPFLVLLDLNADANPFSLGIISQYVMKNEFFIHFFSEWTIFQFIVILLQYFYLKQLAVQTNKWFILFIVVSFYLLSWVVKAFLAYLEISILL